MVRRQYDTSIGGEDRQFPATEWTRLLDHSQKEAILNELCTRYWKPLYSYLRSSGFGNDKAKDLVQSFFTEKIIDQELLSQADRTKGKLRTFLLTAMRNYVINVNRNQKTRLVFDGTSVDGIAIGDPEMAYERAWADQVLQNVLDQLETECRKRGKTIHWQLFHDWLLESVPGQQKCQMKDLCKKFDIQSTGQAYHMIENIKRRFRTLLRNQLEELAASEVEVEAEIHHFINIFQRDTAR